MIASIKFVMVNYDIEKGCMLFLCPMNEILRYDIDSPAGPPIRMENESVLIGGRFVASWHPREPGR